MVMNVAMRQMQGDWRLIQVHGGSVSRRPCVYLYEWPTCSCCNTQLMRSPWNESQWWVYMLRFNGVLPSLKEFWAQIGTAGQASVVWPARGQGKPHPLPCLAPVFRPVGADVYRNMQMAVSTPGRALLGECRRKGQQRRYRRAVLLRRTALLPCRTQ